MMRAALSLAVLAAPAFGQSLPALIHAEARASSSGPAQTHRRAVLKVRALAPDIRPFPRSLAADGAVYRWPAGGSVQGDGDDAILATTPGTPAIAPASGRVAYAGPFRTYGDVLILDHGHGWTTVLTGLATIDAPQGATLAGGEGIGTAGETLGIRLLHHGRTVDVARMVAEVSR